MNRGDAAILNLHTSLNFISIVYRCFQNKTPTSCNLKLVVSIFHPKKKSYLGSSPISVGRHMTAPCGTCASGSDVPRPSRVVKHRSKSRPPRFTTVPWEPVALGAMARSNGPKTNGWYMMVLVIKKNNSII